MYGKLVDAGLDARLFALCVYTLLKRVSHIDLMVDIIGCGSILLIFVGVATCFGFDL